MKKLRGWCSSGKAIKMTECITDDYKICVELGVFGGKSLLPISLKCKGVVYGIDAWSNDAALEGSNDIRNDEWWKKIDYGYFYNYAVSLLKKYGLNNTIFLRMKSCDAIHHFEDNSIDFLHQDSNHCEEISCKEVDLYHNKVKENGIWIFDDTNWGSTKKLKNCLKPMVTTKYMIRENGKYIKEEKLIYSHKTKSQK